MCPAVYPLPDINLDQVTLNSAVEEFYRNLSDSLDLKPHSPIIRSLYPSAGFDYTCILTSIHHKALINSYKKPAVSLTNRRERGWKFDTLLSRAHNCQPCSCSILHKI
jgi:hypothetical protein